MNRKITIVLLLVVAHLGSFTLATKCAQNDIECHEKAKYNKGKCERRRTFFSPILSFSFLFKEANMPVKESSSANDGKKWKKYLDLIEKALKDHKECESSNCSCYKR
jgi:hypothetical protein